MTYLNHSSLCATGFINKLHNRLLELFDSVDFELLNVSNNF